MPVRLAESPPRSIAFDRAPDLPTDREACLLLPWSRAPQHDECGPLQTPAALEHRLEVAGASKPLGAWQRQRPRP